jgi:hypothetical protein
MDNVFAFVAVYDNVHDAESDYEIVKDLHSGGIVGTYDAAVITKDESGKVHVSKDEKPTQHGAWSGLGIGALVGILPERDDGRNAFLRRSKTDQGKTDGGARKVIVGIRPESFEDLADKLDVRVKDVDLSIELETLSFYLAKNR